MAYATQITIVSGRKGSRSGQSYILGGECATTRQQVRDILGLKGLEAIEADGLQGSIELDSLGLTLALKAKSVEIDLLDDSLLKTSLQELRDDWLALEDRDDAFALAELI